jgi:hypothetical protein
MGDFCELPYTLSLILDKNTLTDMLIFQLDTLPISQD